ncbi:MAG: choice-of-anchor K domain-containing protein [Verrucomicrobiales bacterium]|nr:choice-of-anchor K domain-containing protein [Verrucomicrobiales bacterium]
MAPPPTCGRKSGFSLFELLAVVSIIGIASTLSIAVISDLNDSAKHAKLDSDLGVLNAATNAYLASSGDLSSAKTGSDVLKKLKSQASASSSAVYNGFRGSFIDSRTEFIMQTDDEAALSGRRLTWDSSSMAFVLKWSGEPGVKEVRLNNDLAESPVIYEDRKGVMDLAKEDGWIWDYEDVSPEAKLGTTPVVYVPPTTTAPPIPPAITPPPPAAALDPPVYSIPSGDYAVEDYPMALTLTDPNPSGAANIYYQVDFGGWSLYDGGALTLSPYSRVEAQAIPKNPFSYSASGVSRENYDIVPVILDPPVIVPDKESFGFFTKDDLKVTLVDTNLPGRALMEFSINNGPWMSYSGPFRLAPEMFPSGATIEARSVSSGSPYYLPSSATLRYLPVGSLELVGSTVGEFSNPTGTSQLVSNLSPGQAFSYFEWGDGSGSGLSESWLDFKGATFGNIVDGQQFNIGTLDYYNGTILAGTGATAVDFEVQLTLDINGETFTPYFDFAFDLINNPNTTDEIASADFVYLDDARSSRTLVFNDYEFEFKIEFGNSSAQGFTFVDQFHVLEDKKASAELFGTFSLIGPASGNSGDSTQGGLIIADDEGTGLISDPLYQKLGYQDPEQFSKSLLADATIALENAERARDNAVDFHKNTTDFISAFITEHNDRDYYKAEKELILARTEERLVQQEANAANVAASAAEGFAERARGNALIDPNSEDEAKEIVSLAIDARSYSDEARSLADQAASYLAKIEFIWADTLSSAPDSEDESESYAKYLAEKAKTEEGNAKDLRDSGVHDSNNTISLSGELSKKISEGKYLEAENLYFEIMQLAATSDKSASLAAEAATRARALAFEATDIATREGETDNYVDAANASSSNASDYATSARVAADLAVSAASQAESEWESILSTGATGTPVEFAQYLQDKAKQARDSAKSERDDAKSARDIAERKSEETVNKASEGKLSEAQENATGSEAAANEALEAAGTAEDEAFNSRSSAVQAKMIAETNTAAESIATNATIYASEAETYAAEARFYADEAVAFSDEAYARLP